MKNGLNGDFSFHKTLVSNLTPSFPPSKMSCKPTNYHSMVWYGTNVYNTIHAGKCSEIHIAQK